MIQASPYLKPSTIYLGLIVLRVCFALFGTGYIHPDEYFQNGEVTAGRILGLDTWSTWEWDPVFPCRSIVPAWVTTGIPFTLLKLFARDGQLSPRAIFVAERLSFLGSSFLLDYVTYNLVSEPSRMIALILLGSSYVMHTYQVRPFSNSVEAILVAFSLHLLHGLLRDESMKISTARASRGLSLLANVAICGLFTRLTFGAFFLPLGFEVLKWSLRQSPFASSAWIRLVTPPLVTAVATAFVFAYCDTRYFATPHRARGFELTPLNFLRYNMLPSNLAEHGLHPRWLHLVVNLPLIATPPLLVYAFWAEWDFHNPRTAEKSQEKDRARRGVTERMQSVLYWLRWSAITLLSIQPHQEPRFLTPLVTPMIVFVVNNGRILRAKKLFWGVWIVANVILATLFGVLHQGGMVPSLFRVHDIVYHPATGVPSQAFHVVYWKTYMPPRHLLAVRQEDAESRAVIVSDLAGASSDEVIRSLQDPSTNSTRLSVLLVAPFHATRLLDKDKRFCLTERDRVSPHLDLDHIGETLEVGWRDGLSLGIFDVDRTCLDGTVSI